MRGQRELVFWCLTVLPACSLVNAVCPDVSDVTEDVRECREKGWGKVLNDDALDDNSQACSDLQETLNCVVTLTDGCDAILANYLAPALYPWAMTGDALQCGTKYKDGQPLAFENDDCSFHQVYECHEELFTSMSIKPTKSGDPVGISSLRIWLTAKTLLVEDRQDFCDRYMKGGRTSSYTKMSECADTLKQKCQKSLPMHDRIPEDPQNSEEDPYTMVLEIKALADKVCTDACEDMARKEENAKACRGNDFDTILARIKAENNQTENCEKLELVRGCMVTELNDCPYLVEQAEAEREDFIEALKTCGLKPRMSSKNRDEPLGAAGLAVSLTSLLMTLLLATFA